MDFFPGGGGGGGEYQSPNLEMLTEICSEVWFTTLYAERYMGIFLLKYSKGFKCGIG